MANPNGNLAGYADPSTPGWQQKALDRVIGRQRTSKRHSQRRNAFCLYFDDPFRVLLDAAAHRRGMSLSGYARRAIAAMIAHDLGLAPSDVMRHAPRPTEYRALAGHGRTTKTEDDGKGYGPWRITEVDDA